MLNRHGLDLARNNQVPATKHLYVPAQVGRAAFIAAMTVLSLGCGPRDETAGRQASQPVGGAIQKDVPPALVDIRGLDQPFHDQRAAATVLVFTLQDCPIANSYVPTINKLVEDYAPRGIRLLLVHVDSQLTPDQAREHAGDYDITAPVVIDCDHAWVRRCGATRSPEVAVISPAGDILYVGRIDDRYAGLGKRRAHVFTHDLRDAIDAVLAGQKVPRPRTEAIGCFIPDLPRGN